MWEGDAVGSEEDLTTELDYCLKRLHGGDRKPWVYVAAGDLASRLSQWPLALECLSRLGPYEDPAKELRDRLRARRDRVALPDVNQEFSPPPQDILNKAFLEAADAKLLKRAGPLFFLGFMFVLTILSYVLKPSEYVSAFALPALAFMWFEFMGQERLKARALGSPVEEVSHRASAFAFLFIALPFLASVVFASSIPLVLLPMGAMATFLMLSGKIRSIPSRNHIAAILMGS
jgi:hypothetical protein